MGKVKGYVDGRFWDRYAKKFIEDIEAGKFDETFSDKTWEDYEKDQLEFDKKEDKIMTTYRKKERIQAVQWKGDNLEDVIELVGMGRVKRYEENGCIDIKEFKCDGCIDTILLNVGDYIKIDVGDGELYHYTKEKFEEDYEIAHETPLCFGGVDFYKAGTCRKLGEIFIDERK